MRRVSFISSQPEEKKVGSIWYFSSAELYYRVWDNEVNWRVEKYDNGQWTKFERIDRGIVINPSITEVMFSRYRVRADIWNFTTTPTHAPFVTVVPTPCGKGYEASAVLALTSQWCSSHNNGRMMQVEVTEVCSTGASCLEKWKASWKDFCRKTNVTSQFNWDRSMNPTWFQFR